jgi:hypothetical protein
VTIPVIASGIISAVGLTTGIIFASSAASSYSSYKAQPSQSVAESGEQSMFIADVSFGVAALFGFTALALYFFPDDPDAGKSATTRPSTVGSGSPLGGLFRF